jgi:drug/metabolite transporter (DMT)-like permease
MSWLALVLVFLSATVHALWNLLAHSQKVNGTLLLRFHLLTGLVGLVPALIPEFQGEPFPASIWVLVILTGLFQSFYFLGLMMGYRHGNFSIVYPVARALPILFLAFFDIGRGRSPSILGWLGIIFIILGCILAPIKSLRTIKLSDYWNRSTIWILVIMLATVAYTTTDKLAAEVLTPGPATSARYALFQAIFTVPFLWIVLKLIGEPLPAPKGIAAWKWPALFAIFVFTSYWLMLWAFQLDPYISYLSALRQFSLVIGVILAAVFLREDVPKMRIFASLIIVLGMICISQAR